MASSAQWLSNLISSGVETGKKGIAQGQSSDEIRRSVQDAIRQSAQAPAQSLGGMVQQALQYALGQQQQPQQPQYQMAQTVSPVGAVSGSFGEDEEESSAFKSSEGGEAKERKRSPWHQALDDYFGKEGLGGIANDLLSYSTPVLIADTFAPEWAFNPASKEEIAESYANGPLEFNGDYGMPSGEALESLSPEQRQEWQNETTQGLLNSAALGLSFLPIGEAVAANPIVRRLGASRGPVRPNAQPSAAARPAVPVAPGATPPAAPVQQAAAAAARPAHPTPPAPAATQQSQNATQQAINSIFDKIARPGNASTEVKKVWDANKKGAEKYAEKLAGKAKEEFPTPQIQERVGKKIEDTVGKGRDARILSGDISNPALAARMEALESAAPEVKNVVEQAIRSAETAGKRVTNADLDRAMNMGIKGSRKSIVPGGKATIGGTTALAGLGVALGTGLPDYLGSMFTPGAEGGGGVTEPLKDKIAAEGNSSNDGSSRKYQIDEYYDWLKTPEGQAFAERFPDLAGELGYSNLRTSNNREAWEAAMQIPGWWDRYEAAGVTRGDMDSLWEYLYGPESFNAITYGLDQLDPTLLGAGRAGDEMSRWLYRNYDFGPATSLDGWDEDDFAYFALLNRLTSSPNGWKDITIDDVNRIMHAAGENYTLGLIGDDEATSPFVTKETPGARKYKMSDIRNDSWNITPWEEGGAPVYDQDMLDSIIQTYNATHGGARLGVNR